VGGTCAGVGAVGERRGRGGVESAGRWSRCCCLIGHTTPFLSSVLLEDFVVIVVIFFG
jgi:hypothetical protein